MRSLGASVIDSLPHGVVARADARTIPSLIKAGHHVARYPDTDRLEIAGLVVDIAKPEAGIAAELLVPAAVAAAWPLYVVQFVAPPFFEWRKAVEDSGVEVVGLAGRYGVIVSGSPEKLEPLRARRFVSMVHPLLPAWKLDPALAGRTDTGRISVTVFPKDQQAEVAAVVSAAGGKLVRTEAGRSPDEVRVLADVDLSVAAQLASLPSTSWIGLEGPYTLGSEREAQILAENLDTVAPPNTAPVPGYAAALTNIGADGTGVTVAIADSGVDQGANNNTAGHLDLRGRQAAFIDYNGVPTDQNGHGTHVAGIAVGNAGSGVQEGGVNSFFWGQGVAPAAQYVTQSIADNTNPAGSGVIIPAIATLCRDSVTNGATIQNNSWSAAPSTTYSTNEAAFDAAVRDADNTTSALEPLTVVFAARNQGGLPGTIGNPPGAKNVLTVGNGLTRRPAAGFPDDDIRGIYGSSSRGPASGGRIKPDVVAPGTDVAAALSAADATPNAIPGTTHTYKTGTSMSSPLVAGACAVLTEWWRDRTGGKTPSPAMLKALLINGAEDLAGGSNWRAISLNLVGGTTDRYRVVGMPFTPTQVSIAGVMLTQVTNLPALGNQQWHFDGTTNTLTARIGLVGAPTPVNFHCLDAPLTNIPNNDQGWGRVSLDNIVFQSPDSDRGPRLFVDQRHALTANGQTQTWRIRAVNEGQPLRATLVWTDAPGAAGSTTPLVNDLDLELAKDNGGAITTWRGNNFTSGFTTPGGTNDSANNVECVYVQSATGVYTVTVRGQTLVADARQALGGSPWQDYALVLENAEFASADPVAVSLLLDRSGSMVTAGYVDVTRDASKQFVDLMNFDDRVGVVSFGDTGAVEYGSPTNTELLVSNSDKVGARTAIDNISFSGCTYMGQGLEIARDQLAGYTGDRAVVLLSDGKDNKGCASTDPSREWAADVASSLPSSMPVYSCAMGPLSDQTTLQDIAQVSGGRYYYMPSIDDLHEIYNFIRGNVTSDGVIVNTTATASSSRVAANVDCDAEQAVFACHWHADGLRWVGGAPKGESEIQVVLRTPQGELVSPEASWINRVEGDGYVIFTIDDPAPGRWFVEVKTARRSHTRYTVGGWVRSEVALAWDLDRPATGGPARDALLGMVGKKGLKVKFSATLTRPRISVADLIDKHRTALDGIEPDPDLIRNGIDKNLARLFAWNAKLMAAGKPSVFRPTTGRVAVHALDHRVLPDLDRIGRVFDPRVLPRPRVALTRPHLSPTVMHPGLIRPIAHHRPFPVGPAVTPTAPTKPSHRIRVQPMVEGSYTLRVRAQALDPKTGCRFERMVAQSFVVGTRG